MIVKLLNDIILKEEKRKNEDASKGEGVTHWRCSGLGTCMRGRFLDRLLSGVGERPTYDARTLRVFEMGNQVEKWLMDSLHKQDEYRVLQQGEMYDPDYNLSGHFDAVLFKPETAESNVEWKLIECKSKNSKAFWYMDKKGEGAQIHHKMQLHAYLYMLNKYGAKNVDFDGSSSEIEPLDGKLKEGSLVYVSKDDLAMLEYIVLLDDKDLEKMWKYEIDTLNKCWKDKTVPPAPEKGSWQEKYCKFCEAGVCGELDDKTVKEMFDIKEKETESKDYVTGMASGTIGTSVTLDGTTWYTYTASPSKVYLWDSTVTYGSGATTPTTTTTASYDETREKEELKVGDRVKMRNDMGISPVEGWPVKGSKYEDIGTIASLNGSSMEVIWDNPVNNPRGGKEFYYNSLLERA